MAKAGFAVLCRAAIEEGRLISMLGAGITSIQSSALPIQAALWMVARFYWEREECGIPQVLSVRVEHEDGERLIDQAFPVTPFAPPDGALMEAFEQRVVLPLPLVVRRLGQYMVRVVVNGDTVHELPLVVLSEMPPI